MSHQPKSSIKQNKNISYTDNSTTNDDNYNENVIKTYYDRINDNLTANSHFRLYTFGSNEMGQLGQGVSIKKASNALMVPSISNKNIISFSAGDGHSICVSKDRLVYSWGASACGQLGVDNNNLCLDSEGYPIQPFPKQIPFLNGIKINKVACGDAHTLALTVDGQIYSWGGSGCGQLGHPDITNMPKDADDCPYLPYPLLIKEIASEKMNTIACGKAHSLSIDIKGNIYTWGAGASGQLGAKELNLLPLDEDGYPFQPVPQCLTHMKNNYFTMGVCGDVHTIILNDKGEVFSFGGGSFGQLGHGPINRLPLDTDQYPYMPIPKKIESFGNKKIVFIASGDSHSMAIDSEGKLYSWGTNSFGQLGLDNINSMPKDKDNNPYQPEPTQIKSLDNTKVISVSCGEVHSLVLIQGGALYSFGLNNCGQIGIETEESKSKYSSSRNSLTFNTIYKPKLLTSLFPYNISQIVCGGVHNLFSVEIPNNLNYSLFKFFKNDIMTDYLLIYNNKDTLCIKCHKYILISRSKYFYNKIINNVDKEDNIDKELVIKKTSNPIYFKTIIAYMYLKDLSFVSFREISEKDVLQYLKLAKLFQLNQLEEKIQQVLQEKFNEYSNALREIHEKDTIINTNVFNGLFFLPNGSSMLLLDDNLINRVLKESIQIPNTKDKKESNEDVQLSSVNIIDNTQIINEIKEEESMHSNDLLASSLYEEMLKNNLSKNTLEKYNIIVNGSIDQIKYFNQKDMSDITIKFSNGILYANKVILGCASTFFELLLTENMKEHQANEIIINNFSAEEFMLILLIFYLEDNITFSLNTNLGILKGFDMLQVNQNLKYKIEGDIAKHIGIETVASIFSCASIYNYDRLKTLCLYFIQENYNSVVNSKQFEDLQREQMIEIIRYCKQN